MKEKFWNWWNTPITWGASVKASLWGWVISVIATYAWFAGIGFVERKKEKLERSKEEKKLKKSNYYEVNRESE